MEDDYMDIPEFVEHKLTKYSERYGLEINELKDIYKEIIDEHGEFLEKEFDDENDRHEHALKMFIARLKRILSGPPVGDFEIIPVGFTGKRISKRSGEPYSELYAIIKGRGLTRILCREPYEDISDHIELYCKYNTKLGEFSDGGLVTTVRTKFRDPLILNTKPEELLNKISQRITIAECINNLSSRGSDGRVVSTDWRVIRGVITRINVGSRVDGTEYAVCNIIDDSVTEEIITKDGNIIPEELTVWLPPKLAKYGVYSECDFYGTVEIDTDNIPFMNAFNVIPIHVIER